jgi:hypothetical protein
MASHSRDDSAGELGSLSGLELAGPDSGESENENNESDSSDTAVPPEIPQTVRKTRMDGSQLKETA